VTNSAPATLLCPVCGAAAVAGDRFCEACGADLPDGEEPRDQRDPATSHAEAETSDSTAAAVPPCPSCGADGTHIVDGYCDICGMKQPSPRDHVELAADGVAAVSDRGRKHWRNEDAFAFGSDGSRVVAVVCDGVSTTVNPDQASQAAADQAIGVLRGADAPAPVLLLDAFAAARSAVEATDGEPAPPELGWPSCTFLACVVGRAVVDMATMGDCRSYWLPENGEPLMLTEDDSWAAEKIASGEMTPEQAYADPCSHTITRWLGRDADPEWRPHLSQFTATAPGRLVLCSDGLWNYAPTGAELAAAAGTGDPLLVAQRLVTFANESGGHDNITAVVVDLPRRQTQDDKTSGETEDPKGEA
jgi:serine/threonine protein phosphatase PrpC